MIKGILKLYWPYSLPIAALIAGVVLEGVTSHSGALLFSVAIIIPPLLGIFYGIRMYRHAPRSSEAYVTWGAFVTVLMSLYIPLISALLWIVFRLGELSGLIRSLGM